MKTNQEIKEWLLENAVDDEGDLVLTDLDFSDFEGDVLITKMKVKGNLYQFCQEVGGNLYQQYQRVKGDLYQGSQKVEGKLIQTENEQIKKPEETKALKKEREVVQKDNVRHPRHYENNGYETINVIEDVLNRMQESGNFTAEQMFSIGNAIKYITRFPDKNGQEDLNKALNYLCRATTGEWFEFKEKNA